MGGFRVQGSGFSQHLVPRPGEGTEDGDAPTSASPVEPRRRLSRLYGEIADHSRGHGPGDGRFCGVCLTYPRFAILKRIAVVFTALPDSRGAVCTKYSAMSPIFCFRLSP